MPWVNQPRPRYTMPEPKLVWYPTTAPPCGPAQLRVSRGRTGAATGNLLQELVFTNTGTKPCLLRGYPSITAETPAGERRVLHPRLGTFFGRLVPSDLLPAGHVFLDFGTSACGCRCEGGQGVRYRNLVFTLPQGGELDGGRVWLTNGCFLDMSAFGLPERLSQPQPEPGTPGTLRASVRLPDIVRAGATLQYVVTLTNPTPMTVPLSPCPSYTEALFSESRGVQRSYALNCDWLRALLPHDHVEYEMKLDVPPETWSGPAKFGWSLNTPTGPFAGGLLQIAGG